MATPLIEDLRSHWPEAALTAMALSALAPLLENHPHVSEIFSFERPSGFDRRSQQQRLIETLRQGNYDLGILLTNSFSSAWWFWRGHVGYRMGFAANFRSLLLSKAVSFPKTRATQHLTTTYKTLLVPLGIPLSDTPPRLYLTEFERQTAKERLKRLGIVQGNRLIGIHPGAAYGTAKCWPPERFRAVTLKLLQDPQLVILYFGDQGGAPLVNAICQDLPPRVFNLARTTTLRELMALIAQCHIFLTNDSGPMHIADALSIPIVALFGSTNSLVTGPYRGGTLIDKRVECSPCYRKICPIDFRCMMRISVDEVYEAILNRLRDL